MHNKIYTGDAYKILTAFPDESINCCITSPPYYGLRDYGVSGQLGHEETPTEYVEKLVEIFSQVRRVLAEDGTLWLVIGDSYRSRASDGVKPKDLIGIPWMLAFALRDDGWYLRSDIVWHKPNVMPSSVKDRPTSSHEFVFLLSKSQKYYYDYEAIREPCSPENVKDHLRRKTKDNKGGGKYGEQRPDLGRSRDSYISADFMRNKRDVWSINLKHYKGAHCAVFPETLVEPCLLAGCPVGGIVLDPFFGSGTVGVVAKQNNRNYVGIELNEKYCELAKQRIK
jgi:DNA modification methylase